MSIPALHWEPPTDPDNEPTSETVATARRAIGRARAWRRSGQESGQSPVSVIPLHAGTWAASEETGATSWRQGELELSWPQGAATSTASADVALTPDAPSPQQTVAHDVRLVAEILGGMRSPAQITHWATPQIARQLRRRVQREKATAAHVRVISTRWTPVSERQVELVAVVAAGSRSRAVAMRLTYRHRRWLIDQLDLP